MAVPKRLETGALFTGLSEQIREAHKVRFYVRGRQHMLINASVLGFFHTSKSPSKGNLASVEELVSS